jgi:hypothetical protein
MRARQKTSVTQKRLGTACCVLDETSQCQLAVVV